MYAETSELRIGSRKTPLALAQTELVRSALKSKFPKLELPIITMDTAGDLNLNLPLNQLEGKGLFVKELEQALDNHKIDLLVNSLKDMPTLLPKGMSIAAVLQREDPRDVLVLHPRYQSSTQVKDLASLPKNSVIGTSSLRRSSQLLIKYSHLVFKPIRGAVGSRLQKLDNSCNLSEDPNPNTDLRYDGLILAYAGLKRIGFEHRVSQILDDTYLYHAVGQGALAIECREGDEHVEKFVCALDHRETRVCIEAEREFMRRLEGGCSVPLGVTTSYDEKNFSLELKGCICSLDGRRHVSDALKIYNLPDLHGPIYPQALELARKLGADLASMITRNQESLSILEEIRPSSIHHAITRRPDPR